MSSNLLRAIASVAGAAAVCVLSLVTASPVRAEIISMPPHERSFVSPGETPMGFMVGSREEKINRIAPLNMSGTTREALVTLIAYGRTQGAAAGGKIRAGYHIGCAVTLGAATLGATPDLVIGATPSANPNPVFTINLSPGEVTEVALMEKDIIPGKLIQLSIRDYHIKVNSCTGPVTLRQYTYADVKSPEVDDSGAVFGDPTWL
ncbi:MspA family porin [Nocardia sp. NPDC052566]|uniref:MspA family porin n=1 Tax=Nocardia sp. NPDC052566 TaxID=3364330 RepID=UPI0037CBD216